MTVSDAPPFQALHLDPRVHRLRWWTLGILCISLMVISIGNSSLNLVIPTLSRELHASSAELQWVVAGYALVFAGFLFTAGALGDRFGRKGTLQFGLALFLVAALMATASNQMWQIIACRALMGLGGAFIMPSTLSILINVFPPHERPKAIAVWASVIGISGTGGPLLSGLLLDHFWYGSVFLINVPLLAFALFGGRVLVPKTRDRKRTPLDPVGAGLSILGMSSLVFGLIEGPDKGWGSAVTLAGFVTAVVVVVLFVLWERHHATPMIDMTLFRNRAFSFGALGMAFMFVALFGTSFLFAQYLQLARGYSPLGAAIRLAPFALAVLFVAPFTPRLTRKFGSRLVVGIGMSFVAGSLFLFLGIGLTTPYYVMVVMFVFQSTGFALTQPPMTSAIMSAVPPDRAGVGSAMNDTSREFGASLGVAILGSIEASHYHSALKAHLAGLSPALRSAAQSSLAGALGVASSLGARGAALALDAREAYLSGMHLALFIGGLSAVLAAMVVTRNIPRRVVHAAEGPTEPRPVSDDAVITPIDRADQA